MANLIKRILVDASPFDATKRIVRPDGEVRYVRCVGAPLIENQSLKKCVGTAVDVTRKSRCYAFYGNASLNVSAGRVHYALTSG